MIDLCTNNFLTFVRLDNDERRANLKAMYNFYKNTCENYTHIFIEDDSECKIHDVIDLDKNDVSIFTKSDSEWRKGEGFNKAIKIAKSNILTFLDTDIIINPNQLNETKDLLNKDSKAGFIFPYNGLFLCAEKEIKDKFCESLSLDDLVIPDKFKNYTGSRDKSLRDLYSLINNVYDGILVGHVASKGGCVMGRRDNLIKCNGYNPNFLGWGYEDDEAPFRVSKMGYNVGRIEGAGKVIFHLHHFDGTGSKKEEQPHYKENEKILNYVQDLSKEPNSLKNLTHYSLSWKL